MSPRGSAAVVARLCGGQAPSSEFLEGFWLPWFLLSPAVQHRPMKQ